MSEDLSLLGGLSKELTPTRSLVLIEVPDLPSNEELIVGLSSAKHVMIGRYDDSVLWDVNASTPRSLMQSLLNIEQAPGVTGVSILGLWIG